MTAVSLGGGIALAVGLLGFGAVTLRSRRGAGAVAIIDPTPSVILLVVKAAQLGGG